MPQMWQRQAMGEGGCDASSVGKRLGEGPRRPQTVLNHTDAVAET
jgi:hypothetical protein